MVKVISRWQPFTRLGGSWAILQQCYCRDRLTTKPPISIRSSSWFEHRMPRRTWPRFSWGHACHSQKFSVVPKSWWWAPVGSGIGHTEQPTQVCLPFCCTSTAWTTLQSCQDPGCGALFPKTHHSWLCSQLLQKRPHHLPEKWKSDHDLNLVPPSGSHAALSLPRWLCAHSPYSRLGSFLFGDRLQEDGRTINKSC